MADSQFTSSITRVGQSVPLNSTGDNSLVWFSPVLLRHLFVTGKYNPYPYTCAPFAGADFVRAELVVIMGRTVPGGHILQ